MRLSILFAVLAACGGDAARHLDANINDTAPGADSSGDAASSTVTVTITGAGTGTAGVHVYFQNADSSLVADVTTDASGNASAAMMAGGYATAIDPWFVQGNHRLFTWSGVKPGDHLLLDEGISSPTSININVNAPYDATAGAVTYRLFTTCSYSLLGDTMNAPASVGVNATINVDLLGCGALSDVLIVVYNDAGSPLDFLYATGVALVDQQTLDLTAGTYSPKGGHDFTYNNVINNTTILNITDTFMAPHGAIYQSSLTAQGNPAGTTQDMPHFTNAQDIIETTWSPPTPGVQNFVEWQAVADHTTDFTAHMLPDYATYPAFDTTTHTTTFTEATNGGATPDFVLSTITVSRPADRAWDWYQLAPHATSVALPTLPTTIYDYNAASTDSVSRDELIIAKVPGGYDAARPLLFATSGPTGLITGASGVISFQRLGALPRRAVHNARWAVPSSARP
jgi:hypothetical protein